MDRKKFEEDLRKLLKDHGFASEGLAKINIDLVVEGSLLVTVTVKS